MGTTLHHEVIHTVLDSHFYPESLPAWASEGIASQADDAGRKENQRQILARWSKAGRWPACGRSSSLRGSDTTISIGYAAASSVTEFLAERGGKTRVVEFAASGQKCGWDRAASDYYGVHDVAALQTAWQDWVTRKLSRSIAAFATRRPSADRTARTAGVATMCVHGRRDDDFPERNLGRQSSNSWFPRRQVPSWPCRWGR